MKRTFKRTLSILLAVCMIMALMPISAIAAGAATGEYYDIEVAHIFSDASQKNYVNTMYDNAVGDTVLLAVEAPYGYVIDEVYFTTAAGGAFVEYISDLDYDNPISGVYHITMPATDIKANVVYRPVFHNITVNHIYGSGAFDDYDHSVDHGLYEEGNEVVLTLDKAEGYVLDQIIFTSKTEGAFVSVLDVAYNTVTDDVYSFVMPEEDTIVNVIYRDTTADINPIYFFENGAVVQGDFYVGPLSAAAGETVYFTDNAPENHILKEVYASVNTEGVFVEALELSQLGDVYSFVMPEGAVSIYMVYQNLEYGIVSENIFEDGTEDSNVYYNGAETALVGEKVYFTIDAPEGYAVSEVYAYCEAGSFVEIVPVDEFANGYFFTMPYGEVIVTVVYKNASFDIDTVLYVNDEVISTSTTAGAPVGVPVIFELPGYPGCVLEEVIITADLGAFDEVVSYDIIGNTVVFCMPEGDVEISFLYKENMFNMNVYTYIGESGSDSWAIEDIEAGSEYVFTVVPPQGYVVDDVIAVSKSVGVFEEIIAVNCLGENLYSIIMPEADVTLNVVFKPSTYTATINFVDADGNVINESVANTVVSGDTWYCDLAIDGYILDEYFVYVGGSPFYEFYDGYVEISEGKLAVEVPEGDVVVTAVYVPAEYEITINYIENENDVISTTTTVSMAGDTVIISPFRNGYVVNEIFVVTKEGAFGEPVDFITFDDGYCVFVAPTSDVEVSVYVEKTSFEVTLPAGDGYSFVPVDGASNTVPYGGSYSFTVDFADSFNSEGIVIKANGVELKAVDGVYTIENITEAVYVSLEGGLAPKIYNVTFNYYSGDVKATSSNAVISGGSVVAPDAARPGYTFLGWFANENGEGTAVSDFSNVTADAVYYAVYEKNPIADYTFGKYTVTDSTYGATFKEISMGIVKNNAEYYDREVFVIVAAQVKDGSTVLFYVPVEVVDGEATANVSIILSTSTFTSADMYIVYDEVDFTGSLNYVDIETGIQIG